MAADRSFAKLLAADDIKEAQPDSSMHAASIANWLVRTLIASEVLMPRQTPSVRIGSAHQSLGPYYTDTMKLFCGLE